MKKVPRICLSSTTTRMRKGNGDKRGDRDMCDDLRKDLDGFNIIIMLYTGILVYPCLYPWFRKSKIMKHATLCTLPAFPTPVPKCKVSNSFLPLW